MAGCKPLTQKEINDMIEVIRGKHRNRNITMFILGLNTGFRISELLSLTLSNVVEYGEIRFDVTVDKRFMKKQTKSRTVEISDSTRALLKGHVATMIKRGYSDPQTPLFCKDNGKQISRQMAWKVIRAAKIVAGIRGKVATHSMRKTFGTNVQNYLKDQVAEGAPHDVLLETADFMGHLDPKNTLKYLPENQGDKINVINNISVEVKL